jgi:predicted enzyme related to lactoylglutathione lyase
MAKPEQAGDMPPNWCAYVTVDDVDATAAKIEEHGGKLCHPPMDIPEIGRFIHFTDPQGASLAAITYAADCDGAAG